MENSLDQKLDGLQSGIDHKFDNLHTSISKLAQQNVHQEEENPEGECLSDTMVEEQCLQQLQEGLVENFESSNIGVVVYPWEKKEAIPLLLTKEAVEEQNNLPLPLIDSMYILPTAAAHSKPEAPAPKAHASSSLLVQNIRKLGATVRASATTSKTQVAAYIAWHSGWFGCWFGFGAPEPRHF